MLHIMYKPTILFPRLVRVPALLSYFMLHRLLLLGVVRKQRRRAGKCADVSRSPTLGDMQ
jgi:hypothetical protein